MALSSSKKMPSLGEKNSDKEKLLKPHTIDEERSDASGSTLMSTQRWRHVCDWVRVKFTEAGRVFIPRSPSKGIIWIVLLILVFALLIACLFSLWHLSKAVRAEGWPFTLPFIRRYLLGPLPADSQKVIPREHDVPLNQWQVRIQRALPGEKLGNQQPLDQAVNTLREECDFWWSTTYDSNAIPFTDPQMQWFLRNQQDWFANQRLPKGSSPCRLLMMQPRDLPAWAEDFPDYTKDDLDWAHGPMDPFRGRYDTMIAFHEIATTRRESSGGTQNPGMAGASGQPLFAANTDCDVFFSNKSRSWKDVIDHIDRGVKRFAQGGSTMESRLCDSWASVKNTEGNPFPCHHKDRFEDIRSKLKSAKDIAVAIAMDNYAHIGWMVNGGVLVFQPASHTSRFIAEAALTILGNIRLQHEFDSTEQSRVTYVLNQTFNLDMDALKWVSTFDKEDFSGVFGSASSDMEDDEILMLGLFDVDATLQRPLFRQAAERWKKRVSASTDESTHEPMGVAVVFPRWMNAPACIHNWLELGDSRDARFFHCGDFIGHFNGCSKHRIYDKTTRRKIRELCENSPDWPMITNDDGSPFDWETWEAEANNDEVAERKREEEEKQKAERKREEEEKQKGQRKQ